MTIVIISILLTRAQKVKLRQPEFLYLSDFFSLSANGCFKQIDSCAAEEVELEKQLAQAFIAAKEADIVAPIIVGIIPFDKTQPSMLYVPQEYNFFSKTLFADQIGAKTNPATKMVKCVSVPEEKQYKNMVAKAIAQLQQHKLSKIVLSRIVNIELSHAIDASTILVNLLNQNPSVYHFLAQLSDDSTLVGASPERLLRKQGDKIYVNPLAGSACRCSDNQVDIEQGQKLLTSSKDLYQHKLVIDDLKQRLAPLCVTLDVPDKPSLIHTDTMWHLSTTIIATLTKTDTNALLLASQLHPTPALCGFPTQMAKQMIHQLEPHERGAFGGIIGWCNEVGDGEWAVIIRSGIVKQQHITLFAGAGIVAASNLDAEWRETSAKLETMLSSLGITC